MQKYSIEECKCHLCVSICVSVCLSMDLSFRLSLCLSVYLCICLSVCVSVCLSICVSVCLAVCVCVCLSISLLNYISATPFLYLCHASYRSIWFNYLSFFLTFSVTLSSTLFRASHFSYVPPQKQREHSRWPDGIVPQVEMILKSLMLSSVKTLTIRSNPLEGCREHNW